MQQFQPQQMQMQPQQTGALKGWSGSRFSCFDDIPSCFMGFCCPCVIFGQKNERLGQEEFGSCAMTGILYFVLGHICWLVVYYVVAMAVGSPDLGGILGWLIASAAVGHYASNKRKLMKEKYNNQGQANLAWNGDAIEFFWWCCCGPCSLCQEYRTIITDQNVDIHGNWVGSGVALPALPPGQQGIVLQDHQVHTQLVQMQVPEAQVQLPEAQPQVVAVPADGTALPPPYEGPPMPEGWAASQDGNGKTYYYNSVTQESTYDHPLPPAGEGRGCC